VINATRRDALALVGGAASLIAASGSDAATPEAATLGAISPKTLKIDGRTRPAGVAAKRPSFSWTLVARDPKRRNLTQSAAQIVISDPQPGGAVVFDSGRRATTVMALAPQANLTLNAQTPYLWRVRVWDQDGAPSPWSEPQRFTTAPALPWRAAWIAAEADQAITAPEIGDYEGGTAAPTPTYALPLLRRAFTVDKPVRHAVVCLSGLGCYALGINGQDPSREVMNPGWTDYAKTVLYNTLDVTTLLRPGENVLAVRLGDGMYDVQARSHRYTKRVGSYGAPKLILQLRIVFTDGTETWVASDAAWRTHPGPVTFSSIYGGEDCDAQAEPRGWETPGADLTDWAPAILTTGPGGALKPQRTPGLIVAESFSAVAVTRPAPGVFVYDLGQNFAGRPVLSVKGPAGATVRLTPGELLDSAGRVTQASMNAGPDDPMFFDYTLDDRAGAQTWRPAFTYSGFRYVEATCSASGVEVAAITGEALRAGLETTGDFACSDVLLTRTHQLIRRAVLSNAVTILTDCPQREKLGWLEQTYLNAGAVFYTLDALPLYAKLTDDIVDSQTAGGMVPSTAPEYDRFVDDHGRDSAFRDSPEWGSAVVQSPWAAYRFSGDLDLLARAYPPMGRYVDYLATRSKDGLIDYGLGDWYDIGPVEPGPSQLTSRAFTATATWYADLVTVAKVASRLGRTAEAQGYDRRGDAVKATINARLFDAQSSRYDRGSQTANAMALALGLVPAAYEARVLDNLVADIRGRHDHVSAGDIGFHYVIQALTQFGRADALYAMLSRTDPPSYGAQITRGATALTEAWDATPKASQNHFMLGHAEQWLFAGLGGIDFDMSRAPEDALRIAPQPVKGVTWAQTSYRSVLGEVRSRWRSKGKHLRLDIDIPPGLMARVKMPGAAEMRVGSGLYSWVVETR
jgi:alpha-L-rhamnosidase